MELKHALIIDDNKRNIDVIRKLLERQSFTCTEVLNVTQLDTTLSILGHVDVVFLDLEMPVKNGFEVLDYLKSHPDFEQVPIIACSVYLNELNAAHDRGFDGFIGKPLDMDLFPNQVERILKGVPVWETM